MARTVLRFPGPFAGMMPGRVRSEVNGLYMKVVRAQVCGCGPFQAETAGNHPLSDQSGEHFLSRAGCAGESKAHV